MRCLIEAHLECPDTGQIVRATRNAPGNADGRAPGPAVYPPPKPAAAGPRPGRQWHRHPIALIRHQAPGTEASMVSHPPKQRGRRKVAELVPNLNMVFDHLNQPPISSNEKFGKWGALMKEAATRKNIYAKVSGLGTCSKMMDWNAHHIQPYVEFVFENFGIDRCFCGGDWPVSLLAGSYIQAWEIYRDVIGRLLPEDQQKKVYSENAVEFYQL